MALAYCETETQAYCTMGKKTYDSITASLCKETIERFNYQVDESKKSYQESPASAERGIMQVIKEFEDEARRVLAGGYNPNNAQSNWRLCQAQAYKNILSQTHSSNHNVADSASSNTASNSSSNSNTSSSSGSGHSEVVGNGGPYTEPKKFRNMTSCVDVTSKRHGAYVDYTFHNKCSVPVNYAYCFYGSHVYAFCELAITEEGPLKPGKSRDIGSQRTSSDHKIIFGACEAPGSGFHWIDADKGFSINCHN